jgi:hypothetical protein
MQALIEYVVTHNMRSHVLCIKRKINIETHDERQIFVRCISVGEIKI